MVIAFQLTLPELALRLSELFIFLHGQVDVKLEQCIHYLIDILIDSDQIIVNQVPLSQLDPLLALFFLTLQLVYVEYVMLVLLLSTVGLSILGLATTWND